MKNAISSAGLSELCEEVRTTPAQGHVKYHVQLQWQTGTRAEVSSQPMWFGDQTFSRGQRWLVDEPRLLGGSDHAPNPQEYLLSGLGGCLMVAFLAGATTRGVAVETLRIEVRAELDLAGFLGARDDAPVALTAIHYVLHVQADADDEVLESLRQAAERHSPNAMSLRSGVALAGRIQRA
jgi:uncharacterized OsmC-like protein